MLAGVALTSFSALLLELALTRLFSVVLFYHFAFLAISIALLGLGAGGVFAYVWKTRLARFDTRAIAARLCLANSLAIVVVLEIVLHVPVALDVSARNFLRLTALYLASAIPFFLTGLLFSIVFAREPHRIPRLYGADLCGGALACLAVVPLLNWIGGPNAILVPAMMMAVAGAIWAPARDLRRNASIVALFILALTTANYSGRLIDVVYAKGMFRDPAWVEFARWNALSRVEVDRQGQAKAVVIDADASTYIMNADPAHWHDTEWEGDLMSAPPALANVLRPHGEFAIIGPGGGVDVLRAVANGADVTGIEINPIIATTIMRGRYADYSQHLYERPDVHIHVTDGRSFVRSTPQRFDVVQMTLVDTWASTAAGAFALSENNLYTVDAFREYFEHLKPDGMIAITRWEFRHPREALRVVSLAMDALHRLGVVNPAGNFIVISQGELNGDGIPVVVLAKKTDFTAAEETDVISHLNRYPSLHALYLPSQKKQNPFADMIASNDPYTFAAAYPYNVAPVDDNAPFFFFTLKAKQILGEEGLRHGIDWKVNLGVLVLLLVLVISLVGFRLSSFAPRTQGRAEPVAHPSALFRSRWFGLHHGRDRFHSAIRAFPGAPHLRPNCGDFLTASLERRRKPGFAPMVVAVTNRLGTARTDRWRSSRRHRLVTPLALGSSWTGFHGSPDREWGSSRSLGICHGHAIPHRSAGAYSDHDGFVFDVHRQRSGVGLGNECGCQRSRLRIGHGRRHPVRTDRNSRLRRGRLLVRPCSNSALALTNLISQYPGGEIRMSATRVCYHSAVGLLQGDHDRKRLGVSAQACAVRELFA